PIQDPRLWQIHLLVAGALCVVWSGARWICSVSQRMRTRLRLLNPAFPSADRLMASVLLVALVSLSAWGVWPRIVHEFGGTASAFLLNGSQSAAGVGSWVAVLVVLVTLAIRWLEHRDREALSGGLLLVACATVLAASRFAESRQVVMAWRTLAASAFLLLLAALWSRLF